jgi:hypothetical protein
MAQHSVPPYPQFPIHSSDAVVVSEWIDGFHLLMRASLIANKAHQRSLLLHYAGPEARRIINTLPDIGEDDNIQKLIDAISLRFIPSVNTTVERYTFRSTRQLPSENMATFHARLHHLARNCDFASVDQEISCQIVTTCRSPQLRIKALRENLTLPRILELARSMEAAELQAAVINPDQPPAASNQFAAESIDQLMTSYAPRPPVFFNTPRFQQSSVPANASNYPRFQAANAPASVFQRSRAPRKQTSYVPPFSTKRIPNNPDGTCNYCGQLHTQAQPCPARGFACAICGIKNHCAAVCKRRAMGRVPALMDTHRQRHQYPSQSNVMLAYDDIHDHSERFPTADINIQGKPVKFLIDTGASVNTIDEHDYTRQLSHIELRPSKINIFAYKSTMPLQTVGEFTTTLSCITSDGQNHEINDTIIVVRQTGRRALPLLSFAAARRLQLIHMMNTIAPATTIQNPSFEQLLDSNSHLFPGPGEDEGL